MTSGVSFILEKNINSVPFLNDDEKALLNERLAHRLDQEGNLHIVSQEDRSQLMNKERTVIKLIALLKSALHVQKNRKPTKVPKSVIKKRLADKQITAVKKENRRRPQFD